MRDCFLSYICICEDLRAPRRPGSIISAGKNSYLSQEDMGKLICHIYLFSFVLFHDPHADLFKGAEKTQSKDASFAHSHKKNGHKIILLVLMCRMSI